MKILVLGSRIPFPLHDGGAIAIFNMLKCMAEQGHDIIFFSFNTKKHFVDDETIKKIFPFCRVIPVYLDASIRPFKALVNLFGSDSYHIERFFSEDASLELEKLLKSESFDLIHFEGLYSVPFFETAKRNFKGPMVLRQHNVEYRIWESFVQSETWFLKRKYLQILTSRLKKYEEFMLPLFNAVVAISAEDALVFSKMAPGARHFLSPAGFYFENDETPVEPAPNSLFHIGSMQWMPNVQGVQWLVNEVMPLVNREIPQAILHLAGKGLDPADKAFDREYVHNHGEVPDSSGFMKRYEIMCVPLKSGSGLRMKTVEALSMKRAVVSTSLGAAGLNRDTLKSICIADSKEAFATELIRLLKDKKEQQKRVNEGFTSVFEGYSAQKNTGNLLQFYQELLD